MTYTPGDFILCHHGTNSIKEQLIQAGEQIRHPNTDFSRWTHTALIVSSNGDIIEADEGGVVRRNVSKYAGTDYIVVKAWALSRQRTLAVAHAESRLGEKYGWLNSISEGFQALFDTRISVHYDGHPNCSAVVAAATEKYIARYPRGPECMMPADLAAYWDAESHERPVVPGFFRKLLMGFAVFVAFIRGKKPENP